MHLELTRFVVLGVAATVAGQNAHPGQDPPAAEPQGRVRNVEETSDLPWSMTLGFDGLNLRAFRNGRELRLHGGGVVALDFRQYDPRNTRDSGLGFDRAIARLDGWFGEQWSGRLGIDLIGIDTLHGIDEAWIAHQESTALRLSAGMMKIPLGLEDSFAEEDLSFVGYGFPAFLDGRTDLAVRVEGELGGRSFYYDLTAAAGEGYDRNGQKRGDPQYSARLVAFPFRRLDASFELGDYEVPIFSGMYVSAAVAHTPDYDAELDINNPLRNKLFNTDRLDAEASRFLHLGLGADWGPFRLAGETAKGTLRDLKTPKGEQSLRDQITSWQATFSWMITGEPYDWQPLRDLERREGLPAHPLDCRDGPSGLGAFEAAIRYGNGDVDRDFFRLGVTDYNISSQEFRAFSAALNWYPTRNLRATVQVVRTIADQYPATFESHGRDTSYVFRVQLRF